MIAARRWDLLEPYLHQTLQNGELAERTREVIALVDRLRSRRIA